MEINNSSSSSQKEVFSNQTAHELDPITQKVQNFVRLSSLTADPDQLKNFKMAKHELRKILASEELTAEEWSSVKEASKVYYASRKDPAKKNITVLVEGKQLQANRGSLSLCSPKLAVLFADKQDVVKLQHFTVASFQLLCQFAEGGRLPTEQTSYLQAILELANAANLYGIDHLVMACDKWLTAVLKQLSETVNPTQNTGIRRVIPQGALDSIGMMRLMSALNFISGNPMKYFWILLGVDLPQTRQALTDLFQNMPATLKGMIKKQLGADLELIWNSDDPVIQSVKGDTVNSLSFCQRRRNGRGDEAFNKAQKAASDLCQTIVDNPQRILGDPDIVSDINTSVLFDAFLFAAATSRHSPKTAGVLPTLFRALRERFYRKELSVADVQWVIRIMGERPELKGLLHEDQIAIQGGDSEETLAVSRLLCCFSSGYFCTLLLGDFNKSPKHEEGQLPTYRIEEHSFEELTYLKTWMETGSIDGLEDADSATLEQIYDLLTWAGCAHFEATIQKVLCERISRKNLASLLEFTYRHALPNLRQACITFINKQYKGVSVTPGSDATYTVEVAEDNDVDADLREALGLLKQSGVVLDKFLKTPPASSSPFEKWIYQPLRHAFDPFVDLELGLAPESAHEKAVYEVSRLSFTELAQQLGPAVLELDISICTDTTDLLLQWLTDKCPNLTTLTIGGFSQVTAEGWSQLAKLTRLHTLKINLKEANSWRSLGQLDLTALKLPNLKTVSLDADIPLLGSPGFQFFQRLPDQVDLRLELAQMNRSQQQLLQALVMLIAFPIAGVGVALLAPQNGDRNLKAYESDIATALMAAGGFWISLSLVFSALRNRLGHNGVYQILRQASLTTRQTVQRAIHATEEYANDLRLVQETTPGMGLERILRRCGSKVKVLRLRDCQGNYQLGNIGKQCPNLHTLAIRTLSHVDLQGFMKFTRASAALRELSIDVVLDQAITNPWIQQLQENCPNLESLAIFEAHQVSDVALETLARSTKLKRVNLGKSADITNRGVQAILSSQNPLEEFNLPGAYQLESETRLGMYRINNKHIGRVKRLRQSLTADLKRLEAQDISSLADIAVLEIDLLIRNKLFLPLLLKNDEAMKTNLKIPSQSGVSLNLASLKVIFDRLKLGHAANSWEQLFTSTWQSSQTRAEMMRDLGKDFILQKNGTNHVLDSVSINDSLPFLLSILHAFLVVDNQGLSFGQFLSLLEACKDRQIGPQVSSEQINKALETLSKPLLDELNYSRSDIEEAAFKFLNLGFEIPLNPDAIFLPAALKAKLLTAVKDGAEAFTKLCDQEKVADDQRYLLLLAAIIGTLSKINSFARPMLAAWEQGNFAYAKG